MFLWIEIRKVFGNEFSHFNMLLWPYRQNTTFKVRFLLMLRLRILQILAFDVNPEFFTTSERGIDLTNDNSDSSLMFIASINAELASA